MIEERTGLAFLPGISIRSLGSCCSSSGAWCALEELSNCQVCCNPAYLALAAVYLVFAFLISMTWYLPGSSQYVPHWLEELIYPIDKVNLDVLRFAHFLALAVVTIHSVRRDWSALQSWWMWPPIACGQHSLENLLPGHIPFVRGAFCHDRGIGCVLDATAGKRIRILIMIAAAGLLTWYKRAEGRKWRSICP